MIENQVLKRLFGPDKSGPIDGLVVGKKSANVWLVRDLAGNTVTAISDKTWVPNRDWVTVQSGRIVDRSSRRKSVKIYEV